MYHLYDRGLRVVADTIQMDDHTYLLTRVETGQECRGKGYGTEILERVLADADAEGATLLLSVEPDLSPGSLDAAALTAWYSRHGFRPYRDGGMIREPRRSL